MFLLSEGLAASVYFSQALTFCRNEARKFSFLGFFGPLARRTGATGLPTLVSTVAPVWPILSS